MAFKSEILSLFPIVFFASIFTPIYTQYVQFGPCPNLPVVQNLSITKYSGLWYEVEKYWFVFEATASCVSVTYFNETNDGTGNFAVEISQFEGLTGKRMFNPGSTKFLSRDGSADLVLDIVVTQVPIPFVVQYPYKVLGTDYETYTIKWACAQVGPFNLQTMWILSRIPYFLPEAKKTAYRTIKSLGLNTNILRPSNLSTCR